MSTSQEIKGGTTDEASPAPQLQLFLWEKEGSVGVGFLTFKTFYNHKKL